MTLREEAHALGVSIGTVKRRRRARRERRAREYVARSAASKLRLRDPASGCLVRVIGQPINRERDPITGRWRSTGQPKPHVERAPKPEPSAEAVAEVVARYPLRLFAVSDERFETDARRVLDVLASRLLRLDTRDVLKAARDSERLHTAMMLVAGGERLIAGNAPMRATHKIDPLARELYDGALTLMLYDDGKTPARQVLTLARDLVRARLRLGIE